MVYKELKEEPEESEEPEEQPKTSNCVPYAELLSTLVAIAMVCGTLLLTTQMWIQERQDELVYLRANP